MSRTGLGSRLPAPCARGEPRDGNALANISTQDWFPPSQAPGPLGITGKIANE
jgi:hypothetical protein